MTSGSPASCGHSDSPLIAGLAGSTTALWPTTGPLVPAGSVSRQLTEMRTATARRRASGSERRGHASRSGVREALAVAPRVVPGWVVTRRVRYAHSARHQRLVWSGCDAQGAVCALGASLFAQRPPRVTRLTRPRHTPSRSSTGTPLMPSRRCRFSPQRTTLAEPADRHSPMTPAIIPCTSDTASEGIAR